MGHDIIWCEKHKDYEFFPDECARCSDCPKGIGKSEVNLDIAKKLDDSSNPNKE